MPQPLMGRQARLSEPSKPHTRGSYGGSSMQPGACAARVYISSFQASPVEQRTSVRTDVISSWFPVHCNRTLEGAHACFFPPVMSSPGPGSSYHLNHAVNVLVYI